MRIGDIVKIKRKTRPEIHIGEIIDGDMENWICLEEKVRIMGHTNIYFNYFSLKNIIFEETEERIAEIERIRQEEMIITCPQPCCKYKGKQTVC